MLSAQVDAAIVRSIIYLGHTLGLNVVAEGVETEAMLTVLRASGCDVAQGYLLARPMPFAQLASWLSELPSKAVAERP